MQCAWSSSQPLTVSQLHREVSLRRSAEGASPISLSTVNKSADLLAKMKWLSKERGELPATVYSAVLTREQYVASVMNSVSERFLGVSISEALPKLIERSANIAGNARETQSSSESAKIDALVAAIHSLDEKSQAG